MDAIVISIEAHSSTAENFGNIWKSYTTKADIPINSREIS
jgi:hypothetical protein